MRVNMNKTNVMISGECQNVRQKAVRWPCGVYNKGVGSVHKKYNCIKGSTLKVMKSFICRGCLNLVNSAGHTSVDIVLVQSSS